MLNCFIKKILRMRIFSHFKLLKEPMAVIDLFDKCFYENSVKWFTTVRQKKRHKTPGTFTFFSMFPFIVAKKLPVDV